MSNEPPDLEQIQRWMQAVIMHPGGVLTGAASPQAQGHLPVDVEQIENVVTRSAALSSVERLEIYARAYYARLLECLRAEFPVLCQAVGGEVFDQFAFGYLQSYPSRSYTLDLLGANFAAYLRETRPDSELTDWPDFLIDLATLEWHFSEVFDGPGVEHQPLLDVAQLQSISPDRWPAARLAPASCLRVLALGYPVQRFYRAVRNGEHPEPPAPVETYLAITRRDFVVRHFELTRAQYHLLGDLLSGASVGEAIGRVAENFDVDVESFARDLQEWFRVWAAEGFFRGVELG
jgi:hypothetical protein